MKNKLIDYINSENADRFVYNTASLKVTSGNNYEEVYSQLLDFAKATAAEENCIEFFFAPSVIEKGEFMLWEVWGNMEAFDKHMTQPHTTEILSRNVIELQWNKLASWK